MEFRLEHSSIMVADMKRTIDFYEKAFGMSVLREKGADDRDIVFLGGESYPTQIEVIHMHDPAFEINPGSNPTHVAFRAMDFDAAHALHEEMGCIHHELPEFGVYFVCDPDGYLNEVMPVRK